MLFLFELFVLCVLVFVFVVVDAATGLLRTDAISVGSCICVSVCLCVGVSVCLCVCMYIVCVA